MSEPIVASFIHPTPHIISLLSSHLPHSLPLLRRLQFTRFPGGITEHSRILLVGASAPEDVAAAGGETDALFAAAYVDLSRGPETEVWLYSSLESLAAAPSAAQAADAGSQTLSLLRAVRNLRDEYDGAGPPRERREQAAVMFGTLSETVRRLVLGLGLAFPYCSLWDKWVFRLDGLPDVVPRVSELMEGEGMTWGKIVREDTGLVISRTKIPRTERTLVTIPSVAIKSKDGTPIAWAFLGPDGSLQSLHCEEPYRGRGFAKAVAVRLMQDHLRNYGADGYCAADVAPDNAQSQSVCRSLGGRVAWTISWSRIDLDRIPNV